MHQVLADRARYFKNDAEGVGVRCRLLEDMRIEAMEESRIEGKKEGVIDIVRCMIADGTLSLEKIASIAGLPYDEVTVIANDK